MNIGFPVSRLANHGRVNFFLDKTWQTHSCITTKIAYAHVTVLPWGIESHFNKTVSRRLTGKQTSLEIKILLLQYLSQAFSWKKFNLVDIGFERYDVFRNLIVDESLASNVCFLANRVPVRNMNAVCLTRLLLYNHLLGIWIHPRHNVARYRISTIKRYA